MIISEVPFPESGQSPLSATDPLSSFAPSDAQRQVSGSSSHLERPPKGGTSAEPVIHLAPWFALYVRLGARRRALESNQLQSVTDYARRHESRISSSLSSDAPVYFNDPNSAQSAMAPL